MILFSFVLFAVLVLAWLAAPAGEKKPAAKAVAAPVLQAAA
jgi:hypothetical protein